MKTETLEAVSAAANKSTLAGAGITGVGVLTTNEVFGLIGVLIAAISAIVGWYYKRAANKRQVKAAEQKERESEQRMEERALRIQMMLRELQPPPMPEEKDSDFSVLGDV